MEETGLNRKRSHPQGQKDDAGTGCGFNWAESSLEKSRGPLKARKKKKRKGGRSVTRNAGGKPNYNSGVNSDLWGGGQKEVGKG